MSTLIDSYTPGTYVTADFGVPYLAQSFTNATGGSLTLDSSTYSLENPNGATGNAFMKIYASSGTPGANAVPSGAPLATSDPIDVSTISSGTPGLITFTYSGTNRIILTNNTNYFAVFAFTGSPDIYSGSNNVIIPGYNSSVGEDGVSWFGAFTNIAFVFQVFGASGTVANSNFLSFC